MVANMKIMKELMTTNEMKVMNHTNNLGGDGAPNHRLLSYLKQNFSLDVQQIKHIRKSVYLVQMKDESQFIMKGFLQEEAYCYRVHLLPH